MEVDWRLHRDCGLDRMKWFLRLLGDPQESVRVIHIAGTSGKGSTAFLASRLFEGQGLKTGLCLSPHVMDIRERFQVGGRLLDESVILNAMNRILPIMKRVDESEYGYLNYFEIVTGLAFLLFSQEHVAYAIMETGIGGLYDATNCVQNEGKVVVLTRIGLDHQKTLGRRLPEIAFQKASIIQPANLVVALHQRPAVNAVIARVIEKQRATALWVEKGKQFAVQSHSHQGVTFDFRMMIDGVRRTLPGLEVGLRGRYQAENSALATACFFVCAERDGGWFMRSSSVVP